MSTAWKACKHEHRESIHQQWKSCLYTPRLASLNTCIIHVPPPLPLSRTLANPSQTTDYSTIAALLTAMSSVM